MPIYEFYCPENHKIYSFFARSSREADKVPVCPDNPGFRMERAVSSFAVTSSSKNAGEPSGGPAPNADDTRMEAALQVMEREFASLSESENPDPRMLGQMMRRMSEVTGEKVPGSMEEMIRRMEAGEDPESLEESFADFENDGDPARTASAGIPTPEGGVLPYHLPVRRPPQRDPKLYEF